MESELCELLKTNSPTKAQIIRGKLESFSIPAYLKHEAIGQIFGLTTDGLAEIRIMVRPEDLEKARELIEEEQQSDPAE